MLDVGVATVKRMYAKEYRPVKEDVVRLCLVLNLPNEVSRKLMHSASVVLNEGNREDVIIGRMLECHEDIPYDTKIEYLSKCGISL